MDLTISLYYQMRISIPVRSATGQTPVFTVKKPESKPRVEHPGNS